MAHHACCMWHCGSVMRRGNRPFPQQLMLVTRAPPALSPAASRSSASTRWRSPTAPQPRSSAAPQLRSSAAPQLRSSARPPAPALARLPPRPDRCADPRAAPTVSAPPPQERLGIKAWPICGDHTVNALVKGNGRPSGFSHQELRPLLTKGPIVAARLPKMPDIPQGTHDINFGIRTGLHLMQRHAQRQQQGSPSRGRG